MKNCQQLVLGIWDVGETEGIATINDFADDLEISSADIDSRALIKRIEPQTAVFR
ncbi:hypothetical protein KDH_66900 [Dictyobacter sp. S3.2.2.5]|uniref:Uncharacterized protein n=1 Tax=Dictyobacter halimunensis TaxID=3026934 RepID=A0ABQ6G4X2_9CHLR|nr:hypothetical protein KDH_66900 [Dictyobacter sp. S3.2.2.5]